MQKGYWAVRIILRICETRRYENEKAEIIADKHYLIDEVDPRLYGSFIEQLGRAVYEGIYQPESPLLMKKGSEKM